MLLIVEPFGFVSSPVVPVIVVSPTMPSIPSSTGLGATVATITVTMSDGSGFTGTVTFGPPNFNDDTFNNPFGIYAIVPVTSSLFHLVVNSLGPGVGAEGGNTDNVTVVATQ